MKTITRYQLRQKRVANILAHLRIERLHPSPEVVRGLDACIAGLDTTTRLQQKVISRHVTLRRGG